MCGVWAVGKPTLGCIPTMPQINHTLFDEMIATPARGSLMGNRGVLHDDHGRIVRRFLTLYAFAG